MSPASSTALLLSLSLLAGCAAASGNGTAASLVSCGPPSCSTGPCCTASCAEDDFVPSFSSDGRLRRDLATDAPVFVVHEADVAARAPRFNDDGTVCRDAETGTPLYEEVSDGRVVRVLVCSQ